MTAEERIIKALSRTAFPLNSVQIFHDDCCALISHETACDCTPAIHATRGRMRYVISDDGFAIAVYD